MHDEDCQLPSLDWLTDSVKHKSSTLHFPDPLACHFSQHSKHPKIHHNQKSAPKDVDFSKEAIKPPYSYAELITLAMRQHGQSKVLLSDIYDYVRKNFAWYRKTDITWQNSIRHNLSLNKQFIKLPRKKGEKGKGSYWMLDLNAMDSSGLKVKRNGSATHSKMKVLEKGCKPTLNPAVLSYLKKQNEPKKQSNLNNSSTINLSNYSPQIMEIGVDEAMFHPEDIELTSAIDGNATFHLSSSISPPTISSFTEYENEQELLQITDPGNSYYQLQTITEHDKSPVWWRNEENSTFRNSPDFGQPSLPRFIDAFANGSFECPLSSNAETEEHPWDEVDLKITDECLFFDLSM
uniref:Forkhead box protein fkh-2 n=1 Tax=Loa loa TaxID=7209 RepID=A0A1I7VJ12_LOALO